MASRLSDTVHVARAKLLMIETRKWVAGRMNPKKYGEAPQTTINTGPQITEILLVPGPERAQ